MRLQHDLDALILLVPENRVSFRRVFQRHAVRDHKAWDRSAPSESSRPAVEDNAAHGIARS